MGSKFFRPKTIQSSGQNLEARAFGAPMYAGRQAAGRAAKDIAGAQAAYKSGLKPTTKDAAADAPGPKKV